MAFLNFYAGVQPSSDIKMMGWVANGKLAMAVGFNGFVGKLCQIHVAMHPEFHYTPREMLKEAFNYAFGTAGREMLLGVVNSNDERTLKYDMHLGFKELWRIPKMHMNDGDIVVLGMQKADCDYLEEELETLPEPALNS
jgi:hypothetical protein